MAAADKRSFFVLYLLGIALLVLVAAGVWHVWQDRQQREAQEVKARAAAAEAGPSVQVATAVRGAAVRKLTLVGEALPYNSTTLYSKLSGYLKRIAVDVGDRVKAGQFIAEIESPEIDLQIATLRASLENKRRLLQRTQELAQQGFYSKQALDNAQTDVDMGNSQLAELRTLSGYRVLYAPFAGVVTARYADPGALVTNASANQTAALPLVTISDITRLRVTVYPEQSEAPNIKPGLEAEIVDASDPLRKLKGTVARVAGELDPRTRTLLTEVDIDNRAAQLVPGSFVNVNLLIPAVSYIEVPASALVSRDKKSMVALVSAEKTVRLQPIDVAGTDGKVLRIASGVNEGDRVVLNVPSSLVDGARVTPIPAPGAPAAAPAPAAPAPAAPPAAAPPAIAPSKAPQPKPRAKAPPAGPHARTMAPAPVLTAPQPMDAAPPERATPAPAAPPAAVPEGIRKPAPGEV
jgi:RND family efflux transporter MFP subunit